jgi:large repetitive protein
LKSGNKEFNMIKGNFIKVIVFSIVFLCFCYGSLFAQLADSPWPMRGQNPQHTGRGTAVNAAANFVLWKYHIGSIVRSSPAIGADGTVYVGSFDNYIYAIKPDGTLKWRYQTNDFVSSSPAIGTDGTVYIGSYDKYLYAIRSDGTLKWKYQTEDRVRSSPVIDLDGTVYFGSWDRYLYALKSDGTLKWKFEALDSIYSSPAIGADGTVYFGSLDNFFYAIKPDGTLKWKYLTEDNVQSSPAIGSDGTIYFGSWDRYLYALRFDGTLKWKYLTNEIEYSSPSIGFDGTVYIGTSGWNLYAIKDDGTFKWKYTAGASFNSQPAIGMDGTVYIGSWDSNFYAINSDGTLMWVYHTGDEVDSSPAIGKDGKVYVGSHDGFLYSFAPELTHSVRVSSPNGGEYFIAGESHIISWVYHNIINIKIEYSTDNGINWNTITESTPAGTGSYKWMVPNSISTQCIVKISDTSDSTVNDVSNEVFTIRRSFLKVSSPNGGEYYIAGINYNISWESINIINVKLEYSIDEGVNWKTITESISATIGSYPWKVPNSPSNQTLVRITDTSDATVNDVSDDVSSIVIPNSHLADSAWPMRGQNPQHTGRSIAIYSPSNIVKWRYKTDWAILSSPVIDTDGTVYVGSNDNYFYAIKPDGTLKWRFQTGNFVYSTPAIGKDGTIYVGSNLGYLYAIKPDGTLKWKYLTGNSVYSSPAIGMDGIVFFGSTDKYLYAMQQDGTLKWKYLTGSYIYSSPAIGLDGTVYIGCRDHYLYAIKSDGILKWKYQTNDEIADSSPAIGIDGTVYVGNDGYYIYAIKSDGTLKWKYPTGAGIRSSPAIGIDGTVYIGSNDQNIYAMNTDGTLKWKYKTNGGISSSPTIGTDGTVYIGSWDHYLYAIKSEGILKWKYLTSEGIEHSSPAIGADGSMYVGSDDHYLYSFAPEGANVVRVSSPDVGECWIAGESHTITWEYQNVKNIKIELSTDNGMNWTTITESTSAISGSYTWIVPKLLSSQCRVRVTALEIPGLTDQSDFVFTISPFTLSLNSPNGGEIWTIGSTQNISWTPSDITVRLEYSTDNGTNWTLIRDSIPAGDGNYSWIIPDTPSRICRVRVVASDIQGLTDQSNKVFSIIRPVGIGANTVPMSFSLMQNYPNPFNPTTSISFSLPQSCQVTLKVYSVTGIEVAKLVDATLASGKYSVDWKAGEIASGIYFYKLNAGNFTETRKMLFMR